MRWLYEPIRRDDALGAVQDGGEIMGFVYVYDVVDHIIYHTHIDVTTIYWLDGKIENKDGMLVADGKPFSVPCKQD